MTVYSFEDGINCLKYADGTVLMAKRKFDGTLCEIIQNDLEILSH